MAVKRLYLENFRIHKSFLFEGDYDFIFIEGQNGTGKTSILEAISFFAPGTGLRNVKFDDAIKLSESTWAAFINVSNNGDTTDIGMSCTLSARRVIKINDKLVRTSNALLEKLRIIWLTPSQDGLLAESKSLRRKFLDRLVYNFDISHAETMAKYEHALKSRLKLLKTYDPDEIWLTQLERTLAETSIKISASRLNAIARLNQYTEHNHTEFFSPKISLLCEIAESLNHSSYEQILEGFRNFRAVDAKVGRSLYGVHRADFIIDNPIKHISANKSSTGELKIMLISLILAQIKSLNEIDNVKPLLLLDDIFSHLDQNKILSLIQELILIDAQIWITGTNFSSLDSVKICKKYVKVSL